MRTPPWSVGATITGALFLGVIFLVSWAMFIIFVAASWSLFRFLLRLWGGA